MDNRDIGDFVEDMNSVFGEDLPAIICVFGGEDKARVSFVERLSPRISSSVVDRGRELEGAYNISFGEFDEMYRDRKKSEDFYVRQIAPCVAGDNSFEEVFALARKLSQGVTDLSEISGATLGSDERLSNYAESGSLNGQIFESSCPISGEGFPVHYIVKEILRDCSMSVFPVDHCRGELKARDTPVGIPYWQHMNDSVKKT